MKFFISVTLLLFAVDAQEIDGVHEKRYQSQALIELAGLVGCASNCTRKPLNIPQLAVCTATTHLGDQMSKLYMCGTETAGPSCRSKKDSVGHGSASCVWLQLPESWAYLKTGHFCMPKMIADNKAAFLGSLSAFEALFEAFASLKPATTYRDLMVCLAQSNTAAGSCLNSPAKCMPCDDIPAEYYPISPPTMALKRLCLPTAITKIACPLIKEPAKDTERPYCPLFDPKNFPAEACTLDECSARHRPQCVKA